MVQILPISSNIADDAGVDRVDPDNGDGSSVEEGGSNLHNVEGLLYNTAVHQDDTLLLRKHILLRDQISPHYDTVATSIKEYGARLTFDVPLARRLWVFTKDALDRVICVSVEDW